MRLKVMVSHGGVKAHDDLTVPVIDSNADRCYNIFKAGF